MQQNQKKTFIYIQGLNLYPEPIISTEGAIITIPTGTDRKQDNFRAGVVVLHISLYKKRKIYFYVGCCTLMLMQAHGGSVIGESEIIFPVENNYRKSRPGQDRKSKKSAM